MKESLDDNAGDNLFLSLEWTMLFALNKRSVDAELVGKLKTMSASMVT